LQSATSPELGRIEDEIKTVKERLAALPPAPAAAPSGTNGWHSQIVGRPDATVWVQVDLGQSLPLDEIRLYPAPPTDFREPAGFGFPARFKIELSDDATFSKVDVIDDHTKADFPNPGDVPYAVRPKAKTARYVRVTASRFWKRLQDYVVAFAELEVDSGGKNV